MPKTEKEIQKEADRAHQMLFDGQHLTAQQLESLFQGFSEEDKARVENKLMKMFYKDFKDVGKILETASDAELTRIFKTAFKHAVNRFEGVHVQIDGAQHAEKIYKLMADANSNGDWENNKTKILKIFDSLSTRDRPIVTDEVFTRVNQAKNPEITQKYFEVVQLAISANNKALEKIQGKVSSVDDAAENNINNLINNQRRTPS